MVVFHWFASCSLKHLHSIYFMSICIGTSMQHKLMPHTTAFRDYNAIPVPGWAFINHEFSQIHKKQNKNTKSLFQVSRPYGKSYIFYYTKQSLLRLHRASGVNLQGSLRTSHVNTHTHTHTHTQGFSKAWPDAFKLISEEIKKEVSGLKCHQTFMTSWVTSGGSCQLVLWATAPLWTLWVTATTLWLPQTSPYRQQARLVLLSHLTDVVSLLSCYIGLHVRIS